MENFFQTVVKNVHYVAVPMTLFCIYRLIVCRAELARIKTLREKQGKFLSCRSQYTETGVEVCMLPFFLVAVVLPKLWPLWLAGIVIGGISGGKAGAKKAAAVDAHWRDVGLDMKRTAGDSAIETTTFDALDEHGIDGIIYAATDHVHDNNTDTPEDND